MIDINNINMGKQKAYYLFDQQITNLMILLHRTRLKGDEVSAFNELMDIFKNPRKEPDIETILSEISTDLLETELNSRKK